MKYAKSEVAFEHPAKGKDRCAECRHFRAPAACEIVAGKVLSQDWCKKFSRRANVRLSELAHGKTDYSGT
jgi:hypothetical protein